MACRASASHRTRGRNKRLQRDAKADARAHRWRLAGLLLAHVVTWTIYGAVGLRGGIHEDMLEAWVWGKEPQFGYFKHPPLFAWLTGAWFCAMPLADWSFYLLAALNSALAIWAIWLLAGLFVAGEKRLAAVLVAMLTPLYGVLALKFNANSVLLASWPLAMWFFIRSLRHRHPLDAIGVGAVTALAMLSKYYSALLLVAMLVTSLLHPGRRAYWRSSAPYLAAATGLLVLAPHIHWLIVTDGQTFSYAGTKFGFDAKQTLIWSAVTASAPVLFFAIPLVVLLGLRRERWAAAWANIARWNGSPGSPWLDVLAFAPLLLTLLWGLAGVKVSISYTIPIFSAVPILMVLALPHQFDDRAMRRLFNAAWIVMLAVVLASPLLGYVRFRTDTRAAVEPRAEVSVALTQLWHERFKQPLLLVAGSTAFASALPFYSPDHPSQFINFTTVTAPWVTEVKLKRGGLLIVCEAWDEGCQKTIGRRETPDVGRFEQTFARTAYGRTAPSVTLMILMLPPAPRPAP